MGSSDTGSLPFSAESRGPNYVILTPADAEAAPRAYFINMPMRVLVGRVAREHLDKVSGYMIVFGLLFVAVGVASIFFPIFFALTVEQLISWLLLFSGFISVAQFFLMCGTPGISAFLLLGVLHLGVGLWMLLQPVAGSAILVLVLSGWFLANGVLKIMMACQMSNMRSWPAVLVSGLVSIALAFTILILAPHYGLEILGIIFGVDVLGLGLSMILIASMARCGKGAHSWQQEPLIPGDLAADSA
ncbi:hypothetical protein O6H91_09G027000 [Diphasiastrum complanatum]|uniref:Uncharacterized protein n=1 Tax=Diphasiastrum complanatum TaxID=34168 RepID=A0ACC2CMC6_DIPCM|nr:hypothetical protein O6H91_Y094900 [Diphasiastrum complanatum]KAJ7543151.1 hypothetical protein O6H91_09G027000 [Diphasiastrum complanatum]